MTMYNKEGECGTGAVVSWGGKLWAITYAPHKPMGSTDKLYEISKDLKHVIRPESVGGTPANRMIHEASGQLNIGPYFIKKDGTVRTLAPKMMPGRLTGTARHLKDKNKLYIATMEEGLYEVDVNTLEVTEQIKDGGRQAAIGKGVKSKLLGYHGKGLYSGQGQLFYSNNGTHAKNYKTDPTIVSGALASWSKAGDDWNLIRENQFTEITGPDGIYGSSDPANTPIWAMGWDYRSVILALIEGGKPHYYRLPKASHSYDGAHGWNTEWPRIREIGTGDDLLATMHGTFWNFPKTFTLGNTKGIRPRSNYLKVIGDFTTFNGKVVFGCDDSAQKEFLNHRPFKSTKAAPTMSNSNLWFVDNAQLDDLGPAIGRGSVWLRDDVAQGTVSDGYLLAGYDYRTMVIHHESATAVKVKVEIDKDGTGKWVEYKTLTVNGTLVHQIPQDVKGEWIRVVAQDAMVKASVHFNYRNKDLRSVKNASVFNAIAKVGESAPFKGLLKGAGKEMRMLVDGKQFAVNDKIELSQQEATKGLFDGVEQPKGIFTVDDASVVIKEEGKTYRLPKNDNYKEFGRICREVATERDLFNLHGTFYELPARNAQGFAKIRPIATHNLQIEDYGSQFGLLFMTGLNSATGDRLIQAADGKTAVWTGVIDDLWKLGKPRGKGGPWKNSMVEAKQASDPYLMTAYDKKLVELQSSVANAITLEVDIDGTGLWVPFKSFALEPGKALQYNFPEGFSAYWVRAVSANSAKVSVEFTYE